MAKNPEVEDKTEKKPQGPSESKAEAKKPEKEAKKASSKATAGQKASGAKGSNGSKKAKKGPSSGGNKRPPLNPRTFFPKLDTMGNDWKLVDAAGQNLGRLSSHIAKMLMGKMSPAYSPGADAGDHVIVINAEKIQLTGKKLSDKMYRHHTSYPGGIKEFTAKEMLDRNPERLIERAVWGMLPKNKGHIVRHWYGKLRVFAGPSHPHIGQKPVAAQLPDLGNWEKQ